MHDIAWITSLIGMAAVLAAFVGVARRASEAAGAAEAGTAVSRFRAPLFWLLALAIVAVMAATLGGLPYAAPEEQTAEPLVVTATGRQWSWTLSHDRAAAGRPVVFAVSSSDVNHGLGIYDESLTLVAQTQAMPGYINTLRHTFTEPGTYRFLCLEYCGLGHHDMPAEFVVTAP